jgi:hypothetical protein
MEMAFSIATEFTFPALTLDELDLGELQVELEDLFTDSIAEIEAVREGSAIVDVRLYLKDVDIAQKIYDEIELLTADESFTLLDTNAKVSALAPRIAALLDGGQSILSSVQLLGGLLATCLIFIM